MHIIVCISIVPDTTTKIRFNPDLTELDTQGIKWVINPWDDLTLTRAIELKETTGGKISKITVALVGDASTEPTLRKALAMGADEALRIDGPTGDSYSVALQLAEVIRQESYDLILCGIESSDYNNSAVGGMLAELLDIPSVSSVSAIDMDAEGFIVVRENETGKEKIKVSGPFLAVGQKGVAIDPRIPSMRGVMSARTKPLKVAKANQSEGFTDTITYEYPAPKGSCNFFEPDNTDELVQSLRSKSKIL